MSTITRIIMEAEATSSRLDSELRRQGSVSADAPIANNFSGRPDVHVVGRARLAKPIRSVKSRIVPEPNQVQSAPPVRPALPHRT
jgi:hypothetical protein